MGEVNLIELIKTPLVNCGSSPQGLFYNNINT